VNAVLVGERPREGYCRKKDIFAVIDKRIGLNLEVHRGVHGHKQEHGHGVEYEPPLDALPSAIGWVEERYHTLEEQHDESP